MRGLLVAGLLMLTVAGSAEDKPYWTEQASFVQGEFLYAVGVAEDMHNEAIGRKIAFHLAVDEVKYYSGLEDLSHVAITTQRTYTEKTEYGTYNIYRLVRVHLSSLKPMAAQPKLKDGWKWLSIPVKY